MRSDDIVIWIFRLYKLGIAKKAPIISFRIMYVFNNWHKRHKGNAYNDIGIQTGYSIPCTIFNDLNMRRTINPNDALLQYAKNQKHTLYMVKISHLSSDNNQRKAYMAAKASTHRRVYTSSSHTCRRSLYKRENGHDDKQENGR